MDPTATDILGQNSTGFGYIALLHRNGTEYTDSDVNFTLVGPSSLGIDSFTWNTPYFIEGPDKETVLALELIYARLISYRTRSAQVRVEVVPCKTGYYYSANSRTCECVTSNSIICNSTSVCIQKGYWFDDGSKITIPCPTRNCGYSNGHCPPPTEQCRTSPGYCNITGPNDVCQKGRGGYLCSGCRENYAFNYGAFLCVPDSTCKPQNTIFIMFGAVAYWLLQFQVGSGFILNYGLVYYFSVVTLFMDTSIDYPYAFLWGIRLPYAARPSYGGSIPLFCQRYDCSTSPDDALITSHLFSSSV